MNNDRQPASKLRKWLIGNNDSILPGLIDRLRPTARLKSSLVPTFFCFCLVMAKKAKACGVSPDAFSPSPSKNGKKRSGDEIT